MVFEEYVARGLIENSIAFRMTTGGKVSKNKGYKLFNKGEREHNEFT